MRRLRAFTLIELLVVIAIIAILIAILLPVCIKIRRRALVLVCPIAYVGEDGGVYLTDPKGYHSLQISEPGTDVLIQHASSGPLSWSPSGQCLAYNANIPGPGGLKTFFNEPSAGRIWKCPLIFSGWIDSETCFGRDRGIYKTHNLNEAGGTPIDGVNLYYGDPFYEAFAPTPVGADFPYIASWMVSGRYEIGWVRKDYRPGRVICKSQDVQAAAYLFPKVDLFNECAAWGLGDTYVKQLKQDSSLRPLRIYGSFCDWTEDGNLLTIGGTGTFAIYTRDGKLLRTLSPPAKANGRFVAAYRKYAHR
jgi:prepilin-type N-terminal cleavage/methylation domain-containing protein